MIKGIHHTMIELNETSSEYYERALLIVRPEYASVQRAVLEDEAKRMLRELDAPSSMMQGKSRFKGIFPMICSAVCGGMIMLIICLLFA